MQEHEDHAPPEMKRPKLELSEQDDSGPDAKAGHSSEHSTPPLVAVQIGNPRVAGLTTVPFERIPVSDSGIQDFSRVNEPNSSVLGHAAQEESEPMMEALPAQGRKSPIPERMETDQKSALQISVLEEDNQCMKNSTARIATTIPVVKGTHHQQPKSLQQFGGEEAKTVDPHSSISSQTRLVHHPKRLSMGMKVKTNVASTRMPSRVVARSRPHLKKLPALYAPKGVSPSSYTPTILQRLDDYFSQLSNAQGQVLLRLKWGPPVVAHSKQSSNTLDFPRKKKACASVPGSNLYLSTATKVTSTEVPSHSTSTTGWIVRKSPRKASKMVTDDCRQTETDDPDVPEVQAIASYSLREPAHITPPRPNLSLKKKQIDKGVASPITTDRGGQQQKLDHSKKDHFTAGGVTKTSALPQLMKVYELPDSDDDFEDATMIPHAQAHRDSCSPKHSDNNDLSLLHEWLDSSEKKQQSAHGPDRDSKIIDAGSTATTLGAKTADAKDLEHDSAAMIMAGHSSDSGWIVRRSKRLSSPTGLNSTTRKRKKARFMDDSDTESQKSDEDKRRTIRKSMHSDAIIKSGSCGNRFRDIGSTTAKADTYSEDVRGEILTVSTPSPSPSPPSPPQQPSLLFSGSTRGRRQKRDGRTPGGADHHDSSTDNAQSQMYV